MTLASRRIKPITTHHSRQPASMKTWRRYLKDAKSWLHSVLGAARAGGGWFAGGFSPELHLRLVGAFIGELHGNVLQLGLAQAQSGGVLIHHRPVAVHHRAGFCQVRG